ncbi:MAG: pitrilysin family protein, partial [Cyclobacteriaceae bacterium]
MKNRLFIFLLSLTCGSLYGQKIETLKVESYQLDNGFTVFLNPDKTASRVYGAVMVNAGAKHEDPDATGMAHYLEHLLFKGTEKLGTADYAKEKPYLDSINILYEELAKANTDETRKAIQQKINQQALKASEYGLPNEFNKLLKSIGSTGINAFTNYEMTFYHNSFPPHEIRRWLDIYATRFTNPVFRSFQSELEVVYEEKNRGLDNFERKIKEKLHTHLFVGQPYGEWPVLGTIEHLKNPSLIKMYEFFDKYYVSENMALILTGNFDPDKVKPMIAETFKDFRTGAVEQPDIPELDPFDGVKKYTGRLTPVKAGFVGYRTVPESHPDRAAVDVYEYILSNNSGTGLMDQLMKNNELVYSGKLSATYNDAGGVTLFYVPKILVQSLRSGEKKILNILQDINEGNIDDDLFQIAKYELQISFEEGLANLTRRGRMIGRAFNLGKSWEEYISYPE